MCRFSDHRWMDKRDTLESADMLENGAILTFADGKSAYYSASLLRSVFEKADEIAGTADDATHDSTWKRMR
jgi:hypothetical protein